MKETGYNSLSSETIPLYQIYKSELDKGNTHVIKAIRKFCPSLNKMYSIKATWVCYSAIQCFKEYVLPAEYFNVSDEEVKKEYPNYMDEVYEVNLTNMVCIFGDDYTGYLYVEKV